MQIDMDCEECGTAFVAKKRDAKYCGSACRVRANRRPTKTGLAKSEGRAAKPAKTKTTKTKTASKGVEKPAVPEPVYDTLEEQVRKSLSELEALTTISGMNAVRIAQQIDRGRDSGSAVATLSKELSRLVMEAKVESAPKRRDRADDIADRAAEKMAGMVRLVG